MTNSSLNELSALKVFAELKTGSHLYGTNRPFSDEDTFVLVYPTVEQLVSNRNASFPQVIFDGRDTRTVLLGDFVMSLGKDPERSFSAMHYPNLFGEILDAWFCTDFLFRVLHVGQKMFDTAQTPKQKAHGARLWMAYVSLMNGTDPAGLYPMTADERLTYANIRDGYWANTTFDWMPTTMQNKVRHGSVDYTRLAEWVWAKYKEEI